MVKANANPIRSTKTVLKNQLTLKILQIMVDVIAPILFG